MGVGLKAPSSSPGLGLPGDQLPSKSQFIRTKGAPITQEIRGLLGALCQELGPGTNMYFYYLTSALAHLSSLLSEWMTVGQLPAQGDPPRSTQPRSH